MLFKKKKDSEEEISKLEILEMPMLITPSPEPSDILWENLPVDYITMFKRQLLMLAAQVALVIIVMIVVTVIKSTQSKSILRYPDWIDCDQIIKSFTSEKEMRSFA